MMLKIIRCVGPVGSIVDQDNFLSDYIAYYYYIDYRTLPCLCNEREIALYRRSVLF